MVADFSQHMRYFFGDKNRVAVCPVCVDSNPEELLETIKMLCPDVVKENWFVAPAPLLCPEICEELRKAEGILLMVPAGSHVGKGLERVIELLQQQDCEITAAILTDVDVKLLKWYYFGIKSTEDV